MATRTTDTIPEYYDEGFLPWPYDEVPDRMPISMMQSPPINQILHILYYYFETSLTVLVDTNIPIRFNPENHRVFIAPDIMVAFDVDVPAVRTRESYYLWEVGKPPEFALEVASRSTYRKVLYEKPDIYAHLGIGEYWMFDPTDGEMYGQALTGYRLVNGKYEPIETAPNEHRFESGYSEALGLMLCSVELSRRGELLALQPDFYFMEDYNVAQLQLQDSESGLYLLHPLGFAGGHEQAEQRADRAETELEAERAENAKLRERLRQLEQGQ